MMNHSKLNKGCSNTASVITTAIAKADWNAMDADHDTAVNAPASLAFFKDASHTSSSNCSWLGRRKFWFDFPLQNVKRRFSLKKKVINHVKEYLHSKQ
jgi:hypothetical protein